MYKLLLFAAFAFLGHACTTNDWGQANPAPPPADVFYQASLSSVTSKGRLISLFLESTGRYEMSTDFMDNSEISVDTGQWRTLENGNLSLNHRLSGGRDTMMLEFQTDGDKLIYLGKEYGATGLTLWVKPLPKTQ